MSSTEIRETWQALAAQLDAARNSLGWDHPETLRLEAAEAEASDLYLTHCG